MPAGGDRLPAETPKRCVVASRPHRFRHPVSVTAVKLPAISPTLTAVPEGYIVDFLTSKQVRDTPEEYVRQNIEKALIRQYRYDRDECSPEIRIKMGSSKPRVDIIIYYHDKDHSQENAYILVETKRPGTSPQDKKDGIGQLQSYMAACLNAKYGMWTNGDDRYCFAKREKAGEYEFEELVDIPAFGETEDDAARPERKELMAATADNLLFAFRRCHNYIAGNEGMHKTEAFWELLKIIFCKIEDERSPKLDFYVTPTELSQSTAAETTKTRIRKLMEKKVVPKYPTIFTGKDKDIELTAATLAFVVGQLQRYSLLSSPVDVKGVAYEEVVGANLRGDRGEFFTPRNACRMAVKMLNPQPFERILDPACGTGGFLTIAMNAALESLEDQERSQWVDVTEGSSSERDELYRKKNEFLSTCIFGLDLNPALVRAAKMNMVMNNDGAGHLFQANSLAHPMTWDEKATDSLPLGSVDVIFSNPPFGANITIDAENVLSQYELASMWDDNKDGTWTQRIGKDGKPVLQKNQPPEILFIERCVQFLRDGSEDGKTGRMAMVIPNGILNNPALGYVRQWMRHNVQLLAVVDMDRDLFQPKNDTQTSMVLMRRLTAEEKVRAAKDELDYPVFMAIAEKVGHDKRGNAVYKQTPEGQDMIEVTTEEVVDVDPLTGDQTVTREENRDRVINDELPEVADAYLRWVEEHA